jgi:nitrite reductase/ring-hydroxylating ferredoxin subunit
MLSAAQNELVTRVGAGTPLNMVFKRYWQPVLLSSDLPVPDSDPKRFTFLGDRYIAFRDTNGAVGVFAEACCHRGASLALGRVENCGITCIFHGWKFAVDGTILDTPNVSDDSFKKRFRGNAFPAREAADLIWAYFGPRDDVPPFREYEYMSVPSSHRMITRRKFDCNWLQLLEGGLDSTHVGILHSEFAASFEKIDPDLPDGMRDQAQVFSTDYAPSIDVRDTDFGFHYAAIRDAGDGRNAHVRVTAYVFPNTIMIPPNMFVIHDVPVDDTHTDQIVTFWNRNAPVDRVKGLDVAGLATPGVWVNDHMMMNAENRWMQDREKMRNGSWSGLHGLGQEDGAVNLSQGPILDRSAETLVPADIACIRVRQMLLKELASTDAPLAQRPVSTKTVAAVEVTIPRDDDWEDSVPGNCVAAHNLAGSAK